MPTAKARIVLVGTLRFAHPTTMLPYDWEPLYRPRRKEDDLDEPLIWWRALHFAATIMLAGGVLFLAFLAEPAFANADTDSRVPALVRTQLAALAWISLLLAVVSGAAWLVLLAQQLSDGTLTAVLRDGIVWIVLTKTGFGTVWVVRFGLAVVAGGPVTGEPQCPDQTDGGDRRHRPT